MARHVLKADPEAFEAVRLRLKRAEIRLNDRGYALGDELEQHETLHTGQEMRNGAPLVFTGRVQVHVVTHVQSGYGLADGWVILSIEEPKVVQAISGAGTIAATEREFVKPGLYRLGDHTCLD